MKANLTDFGLQEDCRLFQHFPLLAQKLDFFAKTGVLLLNVFMRSRHQIVMLMLLDPLV